MDTINPDHMDLEEQVFDEEAFVDPRKDMKE
jgi:hypothetical protein